MHTSIKHIVEKLISTINTFAQENLRTVQAIYLFGSATTDYFHKDSDIDLAVLFDAKLPHREYFELLEIVNLAERIAVDLIDLKNTDTVMKAIVVSSGERVFLNDDSVRTVEIFEEAVYRNYITLNEDRAAILKQIKETGTIYG